VIEAVLLLGFAAAAQDAPTDRYTAWFTQLDQNRNGVLTADEFVRPAMFKRFDLNSDGEISWIEGLDAADSLGWANRKPPPPLGVRLHRDLAYGPHELNTLDLYVPETAGPHPLLIMIHGGGWRRGDKNNQNSGPSKAAFAAERGWALASINYRLSPEVQHPAHVEDVAAAIAWLLEHAPGKGVDTEHVVLMGHSAGAHLATLVATDSSYLAAHDQTLSDIDGVILLDGAGYDIPALLRNRRDEQHIPDIFETAFTTDPDIQRDASPQHHVSREAGIPRHLIVHIDRRVSRDRSRAYADSLRDAHVPVQVVESPQDSHAKINRRIGQPNHRPTVATAAFLDRIHGPPGMRWVPGGTFTMGSDGPSARPDEQPPHAVDVDGFWIDTTEVTNAQFAAFVAATGYVTTSERPVDWDAMKLQVPTGTPKLTEAELTPSSAVFTPTEGPVDLRDFSQWWKLVPGADWRHPTGPESSIEGREHWPVVHVSWDDARAYAAWAGKALPSEAQWERAARFGHDGEPFMWGDALTPHGTHMANIWQGTFPHVNSEADGFAGVAPVKQFPASELGLYDMAGNVWEWTADRYRPDTYASRASNPHACKNPAGPNDTYDPQNPYAEDVRVQKGGSHLCHATTCESYRPSAKMSATPDSALSHVGFRCAAPTTSQWLRYAGDASQEPGRGRRIVLVAGDEEYRSEESMPMLARMFNTLGFETVVLFSQDPATGEIDPDESSNIPGLHLIDEADLLILQLRFRHLPDADMAHIADYVESGKPVIGIRTATHAFAYPDDSASLYAGWSWNRAGGFGSEILGETWVAHHGNHGREATRGIVEAENAGHPILRGVDDVFGPTDVYAINSLPEDATILLRGAILSGMSPSDPPVRDARNEPMHPIAWTRERVMPSGDVQRIFATTMGAAHDFSSEDLRRLIANAALWQLGEAQAIPENGLPAPIVGSWDPTPFGFGGFRGNQKPSRIHNGWPPKLKDSPPGRN
jgi:formylglycine-generating enzyme required for sulfatase activity